MTSPSSPFGLRSVPPSPPLAPRKVQKAPAAPPWPPAPPPAAPPPPPPPALKPKLQSLPPIASVVSGGGKAGAAGTPGSAGHTEAPGTAIGQRRGDGERGERDRARKHTDGERRPPRPADGSARLRDSDHGGCPTANGASALTTLPRTRCGNAKPSVHPGPPRPSPTETPPGATRARSSALSASIEGEGAQVRPSRVGASRVELYCRCVLSVQHEQSGGHGRKQNIVCIAARASSHQFLAA